MPRNRSEKSMSGDKIVDTALTTMVTYNSKGGDVRFKAWADAYHMLTPQQKALYHQRSHDLMLRA